MAFLNVPTPPTEFSNSSYGTFTVEGHSETQIESSVSIPSKSSINASYTINPFNVAYGTFEILAPPRINKTLLPVMDTYVRNDARTMNFNGADLMVGNENNILYRALLRFDLSTLQERLIFTKGILKLKALEVTDEFTINIYKVNSYWGENTVTFSGQPVKGELVKSFSVSPTNADTSIDIKDLVVDWYKNDYSNYGIVLQLEKEEENHKVRFGSREIMGYEPKLELEYFDPVIPQLKRATLNSYLNIPEHLDNQLNADIEIYSFYETNVLESEVHIHIPNTLESEIEIQEGTIPADLVIATNDSLRCIFYIATTESRDLPSEINISKCNLLGNVGIYTNDSIPSELSISKSRESYLNAYISIDDALSDSKFLNADINISTPSINADMTIATHHTLLSNITIQSQSTKSLPSSIDITKDSLPSDIHIEKWKQLDSDITIRINDELNANILISYRKSNELNSNVFIQQNKTLYVNGFIKSPYLRSNIQIRRNDIDNLDANIVIRDIYPYLLSEISISAQWSNDLLASLTINNGTGGGRHAYGFIF